MPQLTLTLDHLGELANGQAGVVIDAALAAAIRDTEDRGEDEKPRKVTIVVSLTKISEDNIAIEVEAKTTVPPYITDKTIGAISYAKSAKGPGVLFQGMAADRPDQNTLDFPETEMR